MKIVHYIPSIDRSYGGVSTYMQLLAAELGKLVDLHVVTSRSENELPLQNCTIHYIPTTIFGNTKKRWYEILNMLTPDLVHINGCWTPQCAFTQRWAQQKGYSVLLTPHGMLEPWIISRNYWTRKLPAFILYQRRAVADAQYLHATAQSEADNLRRLGYNDNIAIIPNGIDVRSIKIKRSWGKRKKILFLSRIHPKKGVELLIESVINLKHDLENYEFIIAGEGDQAYVDQLRRRVSKSGVGHLFSLCGGVYGDKKWELFRESDIFVLPTYSENFGIVVAEALASGTPVITTTGTPWLELNTNHCGWCVEPTSMSITEALRHAINKSSKELEEMGVRGRELVMNRYSTDTVAAMIVKLYHDLVL